MRKWALVITNLTLLSGSIVSTVACGHSGGIDTRNESAERIFIKTSHSDVDTLNFEKEERYSAAQLGIDKIFNDRLGAELAERFGMAEISARDFVFVVKGYDDVEGKIAARFGVVQDSKIVKMFLNVVQVSGFQKLDPEYLLRNIVRHLPSDGILWTELGSRVKPSYFARKKFWSVEQLGISQYFQFRNADHWVRVVDYEDDVEELLIELILELDGVEKLFRFRVAGFMTTKIVDLLRIK